QIIFMNREDLSRIQQTKISIVLPIVKMATKALESVHRCESRFQALDSLSRPGPSEVAGADCGEKIEAEIGGRGPVGEYWLWIFLEVVRRPHAVGQRD